MKREILIGILVVAAILTAIVGGAVFVAYEIQHQRIGRIPI